MIFGYYRFVRILISALVSQINVEGGYSPSINGKYMVIYGESSERR